MAGDSMRELAQFLLPGERLDVRCTALEYVLGLSDSEEGREAIKRTEHILDRVFKHTEDKNDVISKRAHLILVNLSCSENLENDLVKYLPLICHHLQDPAWVHADKLCSVLANLSRTETGAKKVMEILERGVSTVGSASSLSIPTLYQLVDIFDRRESFNSDANFHHLGSLFLNLSQLDEARKVFLDRSKCLLPRLLPYTQFQESHIRRGGIVGLCKNLCFEVGDHKWLLSEEVDILPALLLPLAGPEQFDEENMNQLPLDLQYLPEDKRREIDPDIRTMLLEALLKLCCTKHGRTYLREKKVYLILRELHKWEEDEGAKEACEKVVQVLIGDEPEQDNLEEVQSSEVEKTHTSLN